jgi:hypothetical protein
MTSLICAIHQPNFFPWLGYFDKLRRADVFVVLDAVDYPRAGSGGMGSWVNRVKVMAGGEPRWVGCPVRRASLGTPLDQIVIDDGQPWRVKLIKTLTANYAKADQFAEAMRFLEPLILNPDSNLAAFNIAAIEAMAKRLRLRGQLVRQSTLPREGHATRMLAGLTRAVGASAYLAGGGAAGYQEDEVFEEQGLTLLHQDFKPIPYGPAGSFTPGLSVIDYLMHDGRPLEEAFPDG